MELRQRGISDGLVSEVIAGSYDWDELALRAHRRKFRNAPRSLAERARQIRFMEYRGFHAEQIRYALGRSTDDEDI